MSKSNGQVCETKVRVRYAETDQMGVVYHANYFVWLEIGRVELLRQLGFSYRDMEREDDCFIAVVDARCRYKSPARYDDEIIVRTYLKNLRDSLIHFEYELVRVSDNLEGFIGRAEITGAGNSEAVVLIDWIDGHVVGQRARRIVP